MDCLSERKQGRGRPLQGHGCEGVIVVTSAGVAALQNAFKSYVRTRDYCTSPKHIMTMCLNAVRVAVEMNNFMHVTNYVSKAEQTPGTKVSATCLPPCNPQQLEHPVRAALFAWLLAHCLVQVCWEESMQSEAGEADPWVHWRLMCGMLCCAVHLQTEAVSEAKLKAAAGLAQLDGRRYKAAARAFVSVNPELGTTYSEVSAVTQQLVREQHTTGSCILLYRRYACTTVQCWG